MLDFTNRNELLDDVIKYIDSMIDDIEIDKRNEELDHYETARHLNLIAMKLSYINEQIASQVTELEDDARIHQHKREAYFDKLQHAKAWIHTMSEAFRDEIDEADRYKELDNI